MDHTVDISPHYVDIPKMLAISTIIAIYRNVKNYSDMIIADLKYPDFVDYQIIAHPANPFCLVRGRPRYVFTPSLN